GRSGFSENHFRGFNQLEPDDCATILMGNPFVEFGNWLDHSEECEIVGLVRASSLGIPLSAPQIQVRLKPEGADDVKFYVSPDKSIDSMVEGPIAFPGVPNALPFANLSQVKDVGNGWKIAFHREATEPSV